MISFGERSVGWNDLVSRENFLHLKKEKKKIGENRYNTKITKIGSKSQKISAHQL